MAIKADQHLLKTTDPTHQQWLLKLATRVSAVVAICLVVIKSIAWYKTGSVAMLGSLLDAVLDSAAALINLVFIHHALQPADTKHRFGHGKAEPIGGVFQAMIIGGSAMFLIAESLRRIINPSMPDNSTLGIAVMLLSSLIVGLLLLLQRYVVKRTGSIIVSGDALHGFGDIVINMGVIASLLLSKQFNAPLIDPIIAILLAGVLLRGAWSIGNTAISQLMDTEFSNEERQHIRAIAQQHERVKDIHDLRTRRAGLSAFIQLHLEMDGKMNLSKAHKVADEVEQAILLQFPNAEVLIHQDPYGSEKIDSFLRS